MKKRKVLALAMATTMMVSSLVGCGSTSSGSAGTAATEGSTTESTNSYTMFIRSQYHDWIKELKWYDVAEETTGITVEYVDGPEEISDTYTEVDQNGTETRKYPFGSENCQWNPAGCYYV